VNLKGRFGGALTQPVTAALSSGDKALEPNKLDSGSGSLTYKAPDDEDKHATAILRTTSKRGIGTLVLAFNTSGATLSLQIKGTLRLTSSILTYEGPVSIGPAEFKKRDGNVSAVVAPATTTLRLTSGLPFACEITATGAGTVGLSATAEKRGQDSVWVVRYDPPNGQETFTGSTCVGSAAPIPNAPGGGGYAPLFLGAVGDIVIPRDGGTVNVSGARNVGASMTSATGTVTATVTKKK